MPAISQRIFPAGQDLREDFLCTHDGAFLSRACCVFASWLSRERLSDEDRLGLPRGERRREYGKLTCALTPQQRVRLLVLSRKTALGLFYKR